jgi:hypothetical protein
MGDPGSWNRFAYVGGDPVNFRDPWGLKLVHTDDPEPDFCDWFPDGPGCSPYPPAPEPPQRRKHQNDNRYWDGIRAAGATSYVMSANLHSELDRLDPNCYEQFDEVLGVTRDQLSKDADFLAFYDVRGPAGQLTLGEIAPSLLAGNQTSIQDFVAGQPGAAITLASTNAAGVTTITPNVFLTASFWNASSGANNILVHELLHYSSQQNDAQLVRNLGIGGNGTPSQRLSDWLANGCKD